MSSLAHSIKSAHNAAPTSLRLGLTITLALIGDDMASRYCIVKHNETMHTMSAHNEEDSIIIGAGALAGWLANVLEVDVGCCSPDSWKCYF